MPRDIEQVDRIGGLDVLRRDADADVLIVAFGPMAELALDVADSAGRSRHRLDRARPAVGAPRQSGRSPASRRPIRLVCDDRRPRPSRRRRLDGGDGAARGRRRDSGAGAVDPAAVPCAGQAGEVLTDIGLTAQEIARQVVESVAGIDALDQPQPVTD